jgi:hypothetical protein
MSAQFPNNILTVLREGRISLQGEFMWGSNYTYLAQLEYEEATYPVVHKPTRGVRPLWDFPSSSLARREVAAYLVSDALGWELVPPSVFRKDGPLGPGSLQLYVDHDPEYHYFNFSTDDRLRLRPTSLFDLVVNNADRKGSHILLDAGRHIWLIDHGLCFHMDDKLRTVIWDFAGERIPPDLLNDLLKLRQKIEMVESPDHLNLGTYLNHQEILALIRRIDRLLSTGCYPNPDQSRRQYPWPPV